VRATALGALDRLGRLTAADLERALADDAAAVRRRAAELAAGHADVPLTPLLADGDPVLV
jgi:hypothetical protein